MRSKSLLAVVLTLLALAALLFVHSCTSSSGGNDGGTGKDAAVDGGVDPDGSTGDASGDDAKIIVQDTCLSGKDQECPPDKICNIETAKCIEGKKCAGGQLWECAAQADPDHPDYCGTDSIYCYCDQDGKTCKRRLLICETCNLDKECGENYQETGNEDRCLDYPDGVKRCGKACGKLACPAGFYCDSKVTPLDGGTGPNLGQCRPSKINTLDPDSCSGVNVCKTLQDCQDPNRPRCQYYLTGSSIGVCSSYCNNDNDCGVDPNTGEIKICNLLTKSCVAGCVDNAGVPNDKKCTTGNVCHSNGHCGSQCDPGKNGSDCQTWFGNSVSWTCDKDDTIYRCQFCLEKNPDGTCKVTGCLNDGQCSVPGYCDRLTRLCQDGKCRDIRDCTSGFKCDANTCVKMDCLENGGQINCGLFEFCCGEKSDIKCKDPNGTNVDAGVCYEASSPPWCTKCESNDDCTTDAGYDGYCFEFQDQDGGTKGKFCGNPCEFGDAGMPIKGQCPRGHQCQKIKDDQGNVVTNACLWARCVDWNQPKDAGTSGGDM
jgi:hypothetical protein